MQQLSHADELRERERERASCKRSDYKMQRAALLAGGDDVNTAGPSNRVFAMKYHPLMRHAERLVK